MCKVFRAVLYVPVPVIFTLIPPHAQNKQIKIETIIHTIFLFYKFLIDTIQDDR